MGTMMRSSSWIMVMKTMRFMMSGDENSEFRMIKTMMRIIMKKQWIKTIKTFRIKMIKTVRIKMIKTMKIMI